MRIAIIGAGNVGSGLASQAVAAGHDVVLTAKDPASAVETAGRTAARAAVGNADAVDGADVVVLAVPGREAVDIAGGMAQHLTGKVVVDATNPLNGDYSDLVTTGVSSAELLQQRVPGARVVKALNTVFAARYAAPAEDGRALDAFLAGDDDEAKAAVGELVESIGFRPVDAGGLRMARALEEMAFLNIRLNLGNGWSWRSAFALVGTTSGDA